MKADPNLDTISNLKTNKILSSVITAIIHNPDILLARLENPRNYSQVELYESLQILRDRLIGLTQYEPSILIPTNLEREQITQCIVNCDNPFTVSDLLAVLIDLEEKGLILPNFDDQVRSNKIITILNEMGDNLIKTSRHGQTGYNNSKQFQYTQK